MDYSYGYPYPDNGRYYRYFHPGDLAPDFVLQGVYKNQLKTFRLSSYRGKWVLLFFYGSNFTFV